MPTKKRGQKAVYLFLMIAAMTAVLLAGCASPPSASPPSTPVTPRSNGTPAPASKPSTQLEKVRLAIDTKGASASQFYVGQGKGFYKEEALDLQMQVLGGGPQVAALMSGEIEFAANAGRVLAAAAQKAPVRMVMVVGGKPPWRVMIRPEIGSLQDLKGKKIGIGFFGGPAYVMMKILEKNGLDPNKDVVFSSLGGEPAVRLVALKSGSVAALLETAPAYFVVKKEGFKELLKMSDVVPEYPTGGLSTSAKKIKDNPDKVKRMIRATLKSMIFAKDNKVETVDILMKELAELGLDRDSMAGSYDDVVEAYPKDGMLSDQGLITEFALRRELGEKIEVPKAADLVDYSLLQEVLKELKPR